MERYLIQVWGCVEPKLYGPFASAEERDEQAKDLFGEEHAVFKLLLEDGIPSLETYSGGEVDDLTGEADDEDDAFLEAREAAIAYLEDLIEMCRDTMGRIARAGSFEEYLKSPVPRPGDRPAGMSPGVARDDHDVAGAVPAVPALYQGYPIAFEDGSYWVGDQDHRSLADSRAFIEAELVGSGIDPGRVRALHRLHGAIERGDGEVEYLGVGIAIEDDGEGWEYLVGGCSTRNLEEALDLAEGESRITPHGG